MPDAKTDKIAVISLVTFASDDMSISAELCVSSAKAMGVNSVIWPGLWTPGGYQEVEWFSFDWLTNSNLIEIRDPGYWQNRGVGFWLWKPYIIERAIRGCDDNDFLIYADAGLEFIEPVQTVINLMDQDIWLFGNEHLHAHWCKRDTVEAVWSLAGYHETAPAHAFWSRFGKQVQASVIFFRVNDYTRRFVKEWLDWCLFEGGRLIDDSPSRAPNHPEFKENRHDQAILTTMAYREGIKLHEWFVKYEGYTPGRMTGYPRELERPLYFHHRRRNADWMLAA